ncbi:hypothetical protein AX14_000868, partial [Amanita brunnescens Koide BX004]
TAPLSLPTPVSLMLLLQVLLLLLLSISSMAIPAAPGTKSANLRRVPLPTKQIFKFFFKTRSASEPLSEKEKEAETAVVFGRGKLQSMERKS